VFQAARLRKEKMATGAWRPDPGSAALSQAGADGIGNGPAGGQHHPVRDGSASPTSGMATSVFSRSLRLGSQGKVAVNRGGGP